jgi:cardiolipin synthase
MSDALIEAKRRGVRVRVLLPDEHLDSEVVRIASKRTWGPLLEQGIEVHLYRPTMMHIKMLIFDQRMVSVGSTNFDMRSFELNDEASLNVYDDAFARQMTAVFEDDLRRSSPYSLQMWRERPWTQRFFEVVVLPIKSQL